MLTLGNKRLDEKYEALKIINTGGMSSKVYLVLDRKLNKQWAIKKIKKGEELDEVALLAEANLMKNLDYPSLPRIVDIEEDKDNFFVVMDFVQGENLKTILRAEGPQKEDLVAEWGVILCDTLTYLHKKNIIYRDMKPSNVMLTPEGKIMLIDFGIARRFKEGANEDTNTLGTEGYAAPEQYTFEGQSDARTDVYGMGVTLFHLLTGVNPASNKENLFSIRLQNPALSSGLDRIILKATERDPSRRYQTTEDLKRALLNYQKYDDAYLEKKKRVIRHTVKFFIMGMIFLLLSAITFAGGYLESNSRYEKLISGNPKSEDIETAINLKPKRAEGYEKLLATYGSEISPGELSSFSHVYSNHYKSISPEINAMIGEAILSRYEELQIRGKLLAAEPYFLEVVKSEDESFEKYQAAYCYSEMAKFYQEFVMQQDAIIIKEANKKDYENLLKRLDEVIEVSGSYKGAEKKSLVLVTNELVAGLISEEASLMQKSDIPKDRMISILNEAENSTRAIESNVESINKKRDGVLTSIKTARKSVDNAFSVKKEEVPSPKSVKVKEDNLDD